MKKIFAAASILALLCLTPVFAAGPNPSYGNSFMVVTNIPVYAYAETNTAGTFALVTSGYSTSASNTPPARSLVRLGLAIYNTNSTAVSLYNAPGTNGHPVTVLAASTGSFTISAPLIDNTEYYGGCTGATRIYLYGYELWGNVR